VNVDVCMKLESTLKAEPACTSKRLQPCPHSHSARSTSSLCHPLNQQHLTYAVLLCGSAVTWVPISVPRIGALHISLPYYFLLFIVYFSHSVAFICFI
jgi:hypothetical protein